ncbi:hypothetical protein ABZY30_36695 [Streptomyces massasporeus]|uniref:hypothetical protein n=1 Tax=Streptomyces massasporeus TaxID=67324 RepID=UPI0033BF1879
MAHDSTPPLLLSFPIGNYIDDGYPNLDVGTELDRVLKVLDLFEIEHEIWTVPMTERGKDAVDTRLDAWTGRADSRNTILYWAGHGFKDANGAGLAVSSTRKARPNGITPELLATALSDRESANESAWMFVVIDGCYSKRFVELVARDLLGKENGARCVLLFGVSGEGATRLGDFSTVLEQTVHNAYCRNDRLPIIRVADDLARELAGSHHIPMEMSKAACLVSRRPITDVNGVLDEVKELEAVLNELDEVERQHFVKRGQDSENGDLTWYFTGRQEQLREACSWLRERDHGLLVVTGPPGSGKSAFLGYLWAHSRPRLRAVLAAHDLLTPVGPAERPPDDVFTATLLLTGMSAAEVVAAIARVRRLKLPKGREPYELADWLTRRVRPPRRGITLLIDALEEAQEPLMIAESILRPLATTPGIRLVVGTRPATTHQPVPTINRDLLEALGVPGDATTPGAERPTEIRMYWEPEAVGEYAAKRLEAAAARGSLNADSDADTEVRRQHLPFVVAKIKKNSRDFLLARLAIHEILARPHVLDQSHTLDPLLGGDHHQIFERAVNRLCEASAVNHGLLQALAFTRGRGLPISGGVWAAVTQALSGAPRPTAEQIDAFLRLAAPYIRLDTADGETVYRLAHRSFQDFFAPDGDPTRESHRRIVQALSGLIDSDGLQPPHPYVSQHLSAHAAAAGMTGWQELARRPYALDLVNARALSNDAVRSVWGERGVPDEIVGVIGARHLLANASPTDRRGIREIGMARHAGITQFDDKPAPPGSWSVHAAWLRLQHPHVTLDRRGGEFNALTSYTSSRRELLVTGGDDANVRIWDPETGGQVRRLGERHYGSVRAVLAFQGPDRRMLLASAGDDDFIRIWNPTGGRKPLRQIRARQKGVRALTTLTLDGHLRLASGGSDGTIRIWDPFTRELAREPLTGHDNWVLSMTSFRNGEGPELLATASRDRVVRIWNPDTEATLRELPDHDDWVWAVTAFPGRGGKTLLATASRDVRIWDPDTGQQVREPFVEHRGDVNDIAVFTRPDGTALLASVGNDTMLRIWNPLTGEQIRHEPWSGHSRGIRAVHFYIDPDGRRLLATAGRDRTVRVWDPTGDPPTRDRTIRHPRPVNAVTTYHGQHGQTQIATASSDGSIRLWDPRQREQIGERLQKSRRPIIAVTSFPKRGERGSLLATAGYDREIRIWDPNTGREKQPPLRGSQRQVLALAAFTASSRRRVLLASAGTDKVVHIWNLETRSNFAMPGHSKGIRAITTLRSPTGMQLATGGDDRTIRIWNPREGIQIGDPIRLPSKVLSLTSFTQDRRSLLAAGTKDGKVWIIDPENHQRGELHLTGHNAGVGAIASFQSAEGARTLLVSGSWNGELQIWDPREREIRAVIRIGVAVTGICVADGRLAVACNEGVLIINLT